MTHRGKNTMISQKEIRKECDKYPFIACKNLCLKMKKMNKHDVEIIFFMIKNYRNVK